MSYQQILYDVKDRIATITLNRPEVLNAWTDVIAEEVYQAMHVADADKGVRVIVLTGAGKAFCAGGDVTGFKTSGARHLVDKLPRVYDFSRRAAYQSRATYFPALSKPVIAMINGACVGLGLTHALFCDLRFAAEDATISTTFARIGLSGEYGMAWMLERIVGHANALDLLISGRKLKGPEALRLGLVNQIHPREQLADAVYAYARDIADNCSPRSVRMMKKQVWDLPFQSLEEAVIAATEDLMLANVSADFKEGVAAFKEKRKPNFPGE